MAPSRSTLMNNDTLEMQAELFGVDPLELFGSSPLDELAGHPAMDPADVVGFSFKKLARGVGRAAGGAVKGAVRVVNKVAKPVISNPLVRVALPMVPAVLGQGPMFELGAKLNPGVAALHKLGKSGSVSGALKAGMSSVLSKIPGGATFVVPKGVPSALAISQADRIVRAGLDPRMRATAQNVVRRTVELAKRGDADAVRAAQLLKNTASMRLKLAPSPAAHARPKPGVARAAITRRPTSDRKVAFQVRQPKGSRFRNWNVQRDGRIVRA
jgi:hypothetical protein